MAEQYMSRRERKEAERRAAEAQKRKEEAAETPDVKEPASGGTAPVKPQASPQPAQKEASPVEPPQFASRAERKAWMRKHGQAPAVSSEPASTSPEQPGQQEPKSAESKSPESKSVEPKPTQKKPAEKTPEKKPSQTKSAAKKAPAQKPVAKKPVDKAAEQKPAAKKPVPAKPTTQPAATKTEAKKPADKKPETKQPESQQPEKKSEETTTPAKRERKSPVVKPPNTEGIRVVSGAVPVVSPENKDQKDSSAPATTDPASKKHKSASSDDERSRVASFATRPLESVDEDPEVTREEWPLPEGVGPAQPMSARSVTHQDGEILVGERSSLLPYIVLGIGGVCAIVLVIVALIMLF